MNEFDHRALDEVIHSRIRLGVMSILASVEDAEFTHLRDAVRTTDGNLSTHLSRLVDAGYVDLERSFVEARPMTRYRLTANGRRAFRAYVDRLERMLGGAGRGGDV